MKKGEVWVVEIPGLDGHEQRGLRPTILVADTGTNAAIVIPCTSNLQALRFPYTIRIESSRKNGLDVSSVALVLQLRTIDKRRLQKRIGVVELTVLREINTVLKNLLSI